MKKAFRNLMLCVCLFLLLTPSVFSQEEGGGDDSSKSAPCKPIIGRDINDNIFLCKDFKNFYVGVDQNVPTPLGHKFYVGGSSMLDGHVGIGIDANSSPYLLQVAGEMNLLGGNSGFGQALFVKDDEAIGYYLNSVGERYASWGYGSDFNYFKRNIIIGGSEVDVKQFNNIPLAKLDIRDMGTDAGDPFIRIGDDVYLTDIDYSNTLGIFGIQNSAIGKIKLGNTGPTLIGETSSLGVNVSPKDRLHVKGAVRAESFSNSNSYIKMNHDNSNGTLDAYGSGQLLINYYSEKNVTIGNLSTPASSNLNVWGDVNVDEKTTTTDLEVDNQVVMNGLANSTTDEAVLVSDANGNIRKRTLPGNAWNGAPAQTLSISGNSLSISPMGNTVTLPSGADNMGNHLATTDVDMDGYRLENVGEITFVGFGSPTIENFSGNLKLNSGSGGTGVGINKIPASGIALDVNGDTNIDGTITASGSATFSGGVAMSGTVTINGSGVVLDTNGHWTSSDEQLKTNIQAIESPLITLEKLGGYTYDWRKDIPGRAYSSDQSIGLIAQELLEVIPEAVQVDVDGYYVVNYNMLVPFLVEGVKEQQAVIHEQQAQISAMENRLSKMEALLVPASEERQSKLIETTSFQKLNLSPNPAQDQIILSDMKEIDHLVIFNLAGVEMKTVQTAGASQMEIDIANLQSGMYILSAFTANGRLAGTSQFVKK